MRKSSRVVGPKAGEENLEMRVAEPKPHHGRKFELLSRTVRTEGPHFKKTNLALN